MIKKTVTWYVVADGARGRIFANDGPGKGLYRALENDFEIEEPRRTRDIVSDREGRYAGAGGVGRHAMRTPTDPHAHEEAEFMRHLAGTIGEHGQKGRYDRLVIVAAPRALGDLRSFLPRAAKEKVTAELNKDLIPLSDDDVAEHLEDAGLLV